MPYIHEYKHDPGYFIRARPPEVGNINYQIKSAGYSLVEDIGLRDGDEISWEEINVLKKLNYIYTEKSGTIGPDDGFQPDPEEVEKWALTEEKARALLRNIENSHQLTERQREEICKILGIELGANGQDEGGTTLDDLLGSEESEVSSEIESILQEWETDTTHQKFLQISGHEESILEFFEHPRNVIDFLIPNGVPTYGLKDLKLEHSGEWAFTVVDARRDDPASIDLFFHLESKLSRSVVHEISVDDDQFVSWRIFVENTEVTGGIEGVEGVDGGEFHRILHDKATLLIAIEQFVENLDNAMIAEPASWG